MLSDGTAETTNTWGASFDLFENVTTQQTLTARRVGQAVLRSLLTRLTRLARTAEEFQDLASPTWGPRLGAYLCAAHFIQHRLREAEGPLLLLDLDGAPPLPPSPSPFRQSSSGPAMHNLVIAVLSTLSLECNTPHTCRVMRVPRVLAWPHGG